MIDVPFCLACAEAPLLLVQARVNDEGQHGFVIDTGNGAPAALLVAPALVRDLSMPMATAPVEVNALTRATLHSFELGTYRLQHVEAAVLPAIDQINERLGSTIAGNLGHAFLKDWRVRIDYRNHRLQLAQESAASTIGCASFETGPGGAFILLPAQVNGRGPYRFLLDTGASSSAISPQLAGDLGIIGQPVEALGVMGSATARLAMLDSLDVAGHTQQDIEIAIIDIFGYTSNAAGAAVAGIIQSSRSTVPNTKYLLPGISGCMAARAFVIRFSISNCFAMTKSQYGQ